VLNSNSSAWQHICVPVRLIRYFSTYRTEIWQRMISPAVSYELYFETILRPTHTSRKERVWPCLLSTCDFYEYECFHWFYWN